MKRFDAKTIEEVDSTTLMERAAKAIYEEIEEKSKRIYIISGSGNNGGDGIALAEQFILNGYKPYLYLISNKISKDAQCFLDRISKYEHIYSIDECDYRADIIIDCILGTGFEGEIRDNIKDVILKINASDAQIIAADIPSGLSGQSGCASIAIKANKTIAIQFAKYGHVLMDGKDYVGELIVKEIGIKAYEDSAYIVEDNDVALKKRNNNTNKGSYGKATIIGGYKNYVGAIKIANMGISALRVGAGLNELAIPASIYDAIAPHVVESTIKVLSDKDGALIFNKNELDDIIAHTQAIAVGMGMGPNKDENRKIITYILENFSGPILIDADGLNAFEGELKYLLSFKNVIITPHPKEFSRLANIDIKDVLKDEMKCLDAHLKDIKGTILLKGTSTIVANSSSRFIVSNGTPALAKGGSGDTLSGVILGLLSQGIENIQAAYMGAYLCAKAALKAEEDFSQYGVLASDVARELKNIIK